jgi:hypothetical protein
MTEHKHMATTENEPPEVVAHDSQHEEQPCRNTQCATLVTDEN